MMLDDRVLEYYAGASVSSQWLEFNRSFANELAQSVPEEQIQALFRRVGARMARGMNILACSTLEQLQKALNDAWVPGRWGFVALREDGDQILISHSCDPLTQSYAAQASHWVEAFFEGAYQTIFSAQGLPASLQVRALAGEGATALDPRIQLVLAKAPS